MAKAAAKKIEKSKIDKVRILDPFKDSRQLWLGLNEEGLRRKVFQVITADTVGAQHLRAGLTIFEPGERCAVHNHPDSEEFNVALKGSGIAFDKTTGTKQRFVEHEWIFIPKGHFHVHLNDGDEPLWLLWCYAPPGDLPTR